MGDPPEITWAIAGTDERWTAFAAFPQRVVGMTPSEVEVERVISIQRNLMGIHGSRFGHDVFRSQTQFVKAKPIHLDDTFRSVLHPWTPMKRNPPGTLSIAAHRLKCLCTLHKKAE
jgi:hypothetical protein